jgi:hypothetical protein
MPKYHYHGSDARVFPTLGLTVEPDTEFEAPEGFDAPEVSPLVEKVATASAFKKQVKQAEPEQE